MKSARRGELVEGVKKRASLADGGREEAVRGVGVDGRRKSRRLAPLTLVGIPVYSLCNPVKLDGGEPWVGLDGDGRRKRCTADGGRASPPSAPERALVERRVGGEASAWWRAEMASMSERARRRSCVSSPPAIPVAPRATLTSVTPPPAALAQHPSARPPTPALPSSSALPSPPPSPPTFLALPPLSRLPIHLPPPLCRFRPRPCALHPPAPLPAMLSSCHPLAAVFFPCRRGERG